MRKKGIGKGSIMNKLLIVRMRGEIGTRRDIIDTFKMLGMKRVYSFVIIDNTPSNVGMVRKIENFAAWGDVTEETEKTLGRKGRLKSPKGSWLRSRRKPPG